MIGLTADAMLRMAGKRIATPVCALVRNDTGYRCLLRRFLRKQFPNSMSLRGGEADVAISYIELRCAARRGDSHGPYGPRNDMVGVPLAQHRYCCKQPFTCIGGNQLKIGTVTGSVWATRKATCLSGQTFLVVRTNAEDLVAADQVGAGIGDRVLLVTGESAARYCMDAPVDAVVVAIVDKETSHGSV
jgi:ethanolamine utilization protein EutN